MSSKAAKEMLTRQLKAFGESELGSFLTCVFRRYTASKPPILAAALAYYATFSLGPLLILFAGGAGIFLRNQPALAAQARDAVTNLVAQMLPLEESSDILAQQSFDTLFNILQEGAVFTFIFAVLVLIWAGSHFFTSLQLALEVIFESKDTRPYWRQRLIGMLLVLSVGLVIGFEAVSSVILANLEQSLRALQTYLQRLDIQGVGWLDDIRLRTGIVSSGLGAFLAMAIYTLSFRFMPRRGSSWIGAFLGALFAVLTTLIARQLMLNFVDREQFNLIYGVITTLMLLLLWLYVTLLLYLLGAVLAAEIEVSEAGRPPHDVKPLMDADELHRLKEEEHQQLNPS